jgi:hypothetical protein
MPLGGFHRHRRFAGALALAGMAFYAVLLPWHTVSQAAAEIAPTGLAGLSEPPCHQRAAAMAARSTKAPEPSKPRTHCPICSGFVALHLAVSPPTNTLAVTVDAGALLPPAAEDDLAEAAVPAPQSRGPPPIST